MNDRGKRPKALGKEARKLLSWLESNYEIEPALPLVEKMLRIERRLQQIGEDIDRDGRMVDGRPHSLLSEERQLNDQWLKYWRCAGLADASEQERRPVGRPPESERWRA